MNTDIKSSENPSFEELVLLTKQVMTSLNAINRSFGLQFLNNKVELSSNNPGCFNELSGDSLEVTVVNDVRETTNGEQGLEAKIEGSISDEEEDWKDALLETNKQVLLTKFLSDLNFLQNVVNLSEITAPCDALNSEPASRADRSSSQSIFENKLMLLKKMGIHVEESMMQHERRIDDLDELFFDLDKEKLKTKEKDDNSDDTEGSFFSVKEPQVLIPSSCKPKGKNDVLSVHLSCVKNQSLWCLNVEGSCGQSSIILPEETILKNEVEVKFKFGEDIGNQPDMSISLGDTRIFPTTCVQSDDGPIPEPTLETESHKVEKINSEVVGDVPCNQSNEIEKAVQTLASLGVQDFTEIEGYPGSDGSKVCDYKNVVLPEVEIICQELKDIHIKLKCPPSETEEEDQKSEETEGTVVPNSGNNEEMVAEPESDHNRFSEEHSVKELVFEALDEQGMEPELLVLEPNPEVVSDITNDFSDCESFHESPDCSQRDQATPYEMDVIERANAENVTDNPAIEHAFGQIESDNVVQAPDPISVEEEVHDSDVTQNDDGTTAQPEVFSPTEKDPTTELLHPTSSAIIQSDIVTRTLKYVEDEIAPLKKELINLQHKMIGLDIEPYAKETSNIPDPIIGGDGSIFPECFLPSNDRYSAVSGVSSVHEYKAYLVSNPSYSVHYFPVSRERHTDSLDNFYQSIGYVPRYKLNEDTRSVYSCSNSQYNDEVRSNYSLKTSYEPTKRNNGRSVNDYPQDDYCLPSLEEMYMNLASRSKYFRNSIQKMKSTKFNSNINETCSELSVSTNSTIVEAKLKKRSEESARNLSDFQLRRRTQEALWSEPEDILGDSETEFTIDVWSRSPQIK